MCDEHRLDALEGRVNELLDILACVGKSQADLATEVVRQRAVIAALEAEVSANTVDAIHAAATAEEATEIAEAAARRTWVTVIMRYVAKMELFDVVDDPDALWEAWKGFHATISEPHEPCPPIPPDFIDSLRWAARTAGIRHRRSPATQAHRTNERNQARLEVRI